MEWQRRAACKTADPDDFTPAYPTAEKVAAVRNRYCAGCPVRAQCGIWAASRRQTGIWGGRYLDGGVTLDLRGRPAPSAPRRTRAENARHRAQEQALATAERLCELLSCALPRLEKDSLPAIQAEALRLRLEHPDLDPAALGRLASPPVTRHAMNGRLRRVREAAESVLASATPQVVAS
jgi:hypothetical protein